MKEIITIKVFVGGEESPPISTPAQQPVDDTVHIAAREALEELERSYNAVGRLTAAIKPVQLLALRRKLERLLGDVD